MKIKLTEVTDIRTQKYHSVVICDESKAKYFAVGGSVEPIDDRIIAKADIRKNQYFMVGIKLFLALVNIPRGTEITETNARETSFAEAINALNS